MSPNPQSKPDTHERQTEIALFRYGLIAALIHEAPGQSMQEECLREIAAKRYEIPYSTRTRVSVSALRRYLKRYRAGGFEALYPQQRSDAGQPRVFSTEILAKLISLREIQPDRTTPMLVEILWRDGADPNADKPAPKLNAHTLSTHLRRAGKTRRLLNHTPRAYQRFERAAPNELWQSDVMHGPWMTDPLSAARPRKTFLFAFIDDHSRLIPYAEFFYEERLPRLERVFKIAMLRRGVPRKVYVDNGAIFQANQFKAACASLGVQLLHTQPYTPESKGKIERFFELTRAQFLPEVETSGIHELELLNQSLWAWIEQIYHTRVHGETQQSPLDRYAAGLTHIQSVDVERLQRAFLWRETRKVKRDATFTLQGNRYQVHPRFAGQTIQLRFDPFDLTHLEIFLGDRSIGPVRIVTQKLINHIDVDGCNWGTAGAPAAQHDDFLLNLRTEHARQLKREIGTLHFAKLLPPSDSTPAAPQV